MLSIKFIKDQGLIMLKLLNIWVNIKISTYMEKDDWQIKRTSWYRFCHYAMRCLEYSHSCYYDIWELRKCAKLEYWLFPLPCQLSAGQLLYLFRSYLGSHIIVLEITGRGWLWCLDIDYFKLKVHKKSSFSLIFLNARSHEDNFWRVILHISKLKNSFDHQRLLIEVSL